MTNIPFVPVMTLAEIPQGSMQTRVLDGREIVICHTREGVFALDNVCTHAHARMCEDGCVRRGWSARYMARLSTFATAVCSDRPPPFHCRLTRCAWSTAR